MLQKKKVKSRISKYFHLNMALLEKQSDCDFQCCRKRRLRRTKIRPRRARTPRRVWSWPPSRDFFLLDSIFLQEENRSWFNTAKTDFCRSVAIRIKFYSILFGYVGSFFIIKIVLQSWTLEFVLFPIPYFFLFLSTNFQFSPLLHFFHFFSSFEK